MKTRPPVTVYLACGDQLVFDYRDKPGKNERVWCAQCSREVGQA